jgi:hypothetical protein
LHKYQIMLALYPIFMNYMTLSWEFFIIINICFSQDIERKTRELIKKTTFFLSAGGIDFKKGFLLHEIHSGKGCMIFVAFHRWLPMVTLSLSQESQHVSWPISHKLCFSLMAGKHNVHHTQAALWKGIFSRISQGNSHIPRTHVRHDLFNLFQINVSSFFYKKKIKQKQNKLIVSVFRIETILFWKKWKQYWNNVILNKNYT